MQAFLSRPVRVYDVSTFEREPPLLADISTIAAEPLVLECVREGLPERARAHIARAGELSYPMPGIGRALLARMARDAGDIEAARSHLSAAARGYPHQHIMNSALAFDAWERSGRPGDPPGIPLELGWDLACELRQPTNPGPIDRARLGFTAAV